MKFSENWLRQHVKTSATRDELAATLTAIGLEVEEMTVLGDALDGVVVVGHTSVDQSPVTGESIPVDKAVGDAVFAGTINATGTFEARVTAQANATLLSRIIHAVEQAQGSRAPTQQFVDRFAAVYTPAVFALALAVGALSPLSYILVLQALSEIA